MSIGDKLTFHLAHLRKQPHPLRYLVALLLSKMGMAGIFSYRRNGASIKMRSGGLARLLWTEPEMQLDGEVFLSRFLKKGNVVVDVGANIGILSLLASNAVGAAGKVVAIEAHPETFRALEDNLQLNGVENVTAVHSAVGADAGVIQFSDRMDDDWNKVEQGPASISVEMQKLDVVCKTLESIDVLKIDVEGYELPVLRGAGETLRRTNCVLLECWGGHTEGFGYRPQDLFEFMAQNDFCGYALREENNQIALDGISDGTHGQSLENFVFVRDSRTLSAFGVDLAHR
ncbi:FkbM family methyltransferase [Roseimicrobium sp. ORNL1]|uniref:FkbM family methyltransferase n=1 Tax=Roseimicrobium sp. ORNL1 TaxID=2711231 RepID=UPI0013E0FF54|nr:FkbM family methyltransferase [Roseimicrobium sp. ORNL1]QIF02927.1 FkbM family methyltransferase [Roseimicrobium sp. ORNL1]